MNTATKTILAASVLAMLGSGAMAEEKSIKLDYSGFVDTNYGFDTVSKLGSFKLNQTQLELTASEASSGAKAVVDLSTVGSTELSNVTTTTGGFDQAYIEKAFGPVNARLGKFYTFMGYEQVPVVKNANVTNSLLYQNEPTTNTGLFVTYNTPVEGLNASVLVANGSREDLKNYGAQVGYTKGIVNATANYYLEAVPGQAADAPGLSQVENRHYLNALASVEVLENLSVAGEYLFCTQIANSEKIAGTDSYASQISGGVSPKQQGYALYAKYSLGDFSVAPRYAAFFMPDGGEVNGQMVAANTQLNQYTLTLKQKFGQAFTAYLEGNVTTVNSESLVDDKVQGQGSVLLGGSFAF